MAGRSRRSTCWAAPAASATAAHGGHRAAAGLTIARGRVDAFRGRSCPRGRGAEPRTSSRCSASTRSWRATRSTCRSPRSSSGSPRRHGPPQPTLLVPSALLDDPRPMGEGATSRSRSGRRRALALRQLRPRSALPAAPASPGRRRPLEVNRYNGAVEPRLVLRHARRRGRRRSRWSASPLRRGAAGGARARPGSLARRAVPLGRDPAAGPSLAPRGSSTTCAGRWTGSGCRVPVRSASPRRRHRRPLGDLVAGGAPGSRWPRTRSTARARCATGSAASR